jgi:hypothetical protein
VSDDSLFAGVPLEVDPGMPPGTIDLRSGRHWRRMVLPDAVRVKVVAVRLRAETDAAFAAELAEEIESLAESKDWLTHPGGMTEPERCGACGTLVAMVPEVHVTRRGDPEPALWEAGQWRKHTPRRCQAMRKAA